RGRPDRRGRWRPDRRADRRGHHQPRQALVGVNPTRAAAKARARQRPAAAALAAAALLLAGCVAEAQVPAGTSQVQRPRAPLAAAPVPPAPKPARPAASALAALPEAGLAPAAPAEPAVSESFFGTASWYGRKFHGRLTASGERYDMAGLPAAHQAGPFGRRVRVTLLANDPP